MKEEERAVEKRKCQIGGKQLYGTTACRNFVTGNLYIRLSLTQFEKGEGEEEGGESGSKEGGEKRKAGKKSSAFLLLLSDVYCL